MFKKYWGIIVFAAAAASLYAYHVHAISVAVAKEQERVKSEFLVKQLYAKTEIDSLSISLLNNAMDSVRKKDEQLQSISAQYRSLVNSLQQRASRGSSPTPSIAGTCTGAELYRQDGEFLAREAARAERIREERDYYYGEYERARTQLEAFKSRTAR